MQKRLEYFYKSYDIDGTNPMEKKSFEIMNEYGYNFEANNKRTVDYEKKCRRLLYTDIKRHNNKGKR